MRKIILFIAISIDGYISDINGNVDWLCGENPNIMDKYNTYNNFIKDIDTIIMGKNTYNQIIYDLSPKKWPYEGIKSYIITHKIQKSNNNDIIFTSSDLFSLINKLKSTNSNKNVWICGGANIVQQLINKNLIDKYHICIIPRIIGNGIRLFDNILNNTKLRLIKNSSYNSIVDLIYEVI